MSARTRLGKERPEVVSFLLEVTRDTSFYFHAAYAAIGAIIMGYSICLALRAGKNRKR